MSELTPEQVLEILTKREFETNRGWRIDGAVPSAEAARLEATVDAWERYGKLPGHEWSCRSTHGTGMPCDCDYGPARKVLADAGWLE